MDGDAASTLITGLVWLCTTLNDVNENAFVKPKLKEYNTTYVINANFEQEQHAPFSLSQNIVKGISLNHNCKFLKLSGCILWKRVFIDAGVKRSSWTKESSFDVEISYFTYILNLMKRWHFEVSFVALLLLYSSELYLLLLESPTLLKWKKKVT